jgi:hypothetical protein
MRKILSLILLAFSVSFFGSCSDDATKPETSHNDSIIHGQIHDTDFQYEIVGGEPGDPTAGPFLLRGSNLHYNDEDGALVVDLTVVNRGSVAQHEPIGLTFIRLDPDEVTVLNRTATFTATARPSCFHFANDDNLWTPGEESLPRTVEFGVSKGAAIAFVARLDLGAPVELGTVAGRVWNDANKDGVMQDGEDGLGGILVYLYPFLATGNTTPTREFGVATTDRDGHYAFHALSAGGYVVSIAPSTLMLFPTTPTEIHVLLVETDGGVSSYRGANFGAVPGDVPPPPPPTSEHLHATGKFAAPDHFAAASAELFVCPDSLPIPLTDPPVNDDCIGGRLRGTVTEVAPLRNAFRIMATWVMIAGVVDPPLEIKVGARLDVHVHQGPRTGGMGGRLDRAIHRRFRRDSWAASRASVFPRTNRALLRTQHLDLRLPHQGLNQRHTQRMLFIDTYRPDHHISKRR